MQNNQQKNSQFFQLEKTCGKARAGVINTAHGQIQTPIFMPVATQSAIKAVSFEQLDFCKPEIVLSNTYHLHLRPGEDLIHKAGGLHSWTHYEKPFLTDSGGFQIFSQSSIDKCKINDDGAEFIDNINGSKHFISPEKSIEIQNKLGADIIMAFDHCPNGKATYEQTKLAMDRTHLWAERCFNSHKKGLETGLAPDFQSLFLIVQGGIFKDLREQSVKEITKLDVPGYAIGGVSVGESREEIDEIVEFTTPLLPQDKPRYLMGVGTKEDIVKAIAAGIDMFDCVMPTRIGRHGCFFDENGTRSQIKAEKYKEDFSPLAPNCQNYLGRPYSKAYIRHLWKVNEIVAGTLLSIHNIHYLIDLTKRIRGHIMDGNFDLKDYL